MVAPIIPILILAVGAAFGVSACSGNDGGGNGTGDVDTDSDVDTDTDTDTVTDTETDTETDTDTDPCERPGVNADYYHCEWGSDDCSMIDVDVSGSELSMMTDHPVNRMGQVVIEESDPMGFDEDVYVNFGLGDQFFIGQQFDGYGGVSPLQVQEIAPDGIFFVPFTYNGEIDSATAALSGFAFLDADTSPTVDPVVQGINPITVPYEMYLTGLGVGAIYENEDENRFGAAMNDHITDNGMFTSYGFTYSTSISQGDIDFPVFTSGKNVSAMAMIDETHAAVVNTQGGDQSWQIDGASIDIIDTTISAWATSSEEADGAKVATIPLGAGVELVSFPELPMNDEKTIAVVAGGTEGLLATIYVIDLESNTVAGSLDLSEYANAIKGISSIVGDKIAVSVDGEPHSEEATGGHVITIDISDPAAPAIDILVQDLGYRMGALDMFEMSGNLYINVVAQSSFCEEEPSSAEAPYKTMLSVDPVAATSE